MRTRTTLTSSLTYTAANADVSTCAASVLVRALAFAVYRDRQPSSITHCHT
jgi:hypothetical protein